MVRKCFSINEFGPSLLDGTNAFLRAPACLHGRAVSGHCCFPGKTIPGGPQGLSPVSMRPRMAVAVPNDRRIAAAERLHANRQRPASTCWFLTAIRLLWNPLDQHGLSVVTLFGEEPFSFKQGQPAQKVYRNISPHR